MRVRGRLIIAGCVAAATTREIAHAQRSRRDGWLDAGYTRVRQQGFAPSDVGSLAAMWRCAADALFVQASGSLLASPDGGAIGAGSLEAWGRAWSTRTWRLDLGGSADGVTSTDLPSAVHGALAARATHGAGSAASWAGISAGLLAHDGISLPSLIADVGTSRRVSAPGELRLGATVTGTLVRRDEVQVTSGSVRIAGRERYAELTTFGEWSLGRASLAVTTGARIEETGTSQRAARAFALGDVSYGIAPSVALLVAGGHQLADPTRALGAVDYATVGLRFTAPRLLTARRATASEAGAAVGRALALLERAEGGDGIATVAETRLTIIVAAERVEVMGDFSAWEPIALERQGTRWRLARALPSGSHRLLVRIDGGEWRVPVNLPDASDDLGGKVGLLVVPE